MAPKFAWVVFLCLLATARTAGQTSNIDIVHTKIALQFDWNKKQASGEATISLRLTSPARAVTLAADELAVKSVTTSNGQNLPFSLTSDKKSIEIQLSREYPAGQDLTFTIVYETRHHNDPDPNAPGGSFGKGLRFFQPTGANPIKRRQIWSQGEFQYNSYWFPCSHNQEDLRTTELIATVDSGLTVISNGQLVRVTDSPGSQRTFHYRSEVPYPNYLTAFVVGEYVDHVQYFDKIPLHTYCYPDEKEAAVATTERLPDMLRFLTEKTGVKYPFAEYAQVVVQDYPFPSLNGQHTFSILSDNLIDDYGTHQDYQFLWDGVEFNALAGQWFGNLLIPKQPEDQWLAKSFCQFFEGLYTSEKHGTAEYLLWYHPWENSSVAADWDNGNRHPMVTTQYDNVENFVGDSYAKYRGALILRMLRKEIGDAQFFQVIQHFLKNNAFRPVDTRDFQASVQAVTGNDFQWFFNQWVYQMGQPVFEVAGNYDTKNQAYQLTLRQVQQPDSTTSYPQTGYFQGQMDIEIGNRIFSIRLKPQAENHFSFSMPAPPQWVNVDVDNTWIGEFRHPKTLPEWLLQLQNSRDAAAQSEAMTELAALATAENTTPACREQIYAAFRNVIQSPLYWRLRMNAIVQLRSIEPKPYSPATTEMLLSLIQHEKSWIKAAALTSLGATADPQYADLYVANLRDSSDRVVNAAAIALGKTKSPQAFDALVQLKSRPSWKNQSLMHALSGLAQLKDPRAEAVAVAAIADNRSPRWFLGNGWDYPVVAAQTLAALGKPEQAFPIVLERLNTALKENCTDDVFHQALLIATLADPRGQEVFKTLKNEYKNDTNALAAIDALEAQFQAALRNKNK